jgi:DNA-binding MarR family transcriptional regulator
VEQSENLVSLLTRLVRQFFLPDGHVVANHPVTQLRACAILYHGPLSMSALSRELGISLSSMTQITDRLERARLVKRVAGETDRRVKRLQLTAQGEKIMRSREQSRLRRVEEVLKRLSPRSRSKILASLETLAEACAAVNAEEKLLARSSNGKQVAPLY